MDVLDKKTEPTGGALRQWLRGAAEKRKNNAAALCFDLLCAGVAFLFSRCHLFFGAYPLGVAFVSCLPERVPMALAGAIVGSLSLGKDGFVTAMIALITVFLRVAVSGGQEHDASSGGVFSEPILLRASLATIGGLVAGLYQILVFGFSLQTILYAFTMIFACGIGSALFGGLFFTPLKWRTFLFGNDALLTARTARARDKFGVIARQVSLLGYAFFLTLSLARFSLFGLSLAYVFAGAAVLFTAGRFGTLRAAAVGFFACLGVSGTASVAFALGGAAAGLLFRLGLGYATLGYLGAVGAWSAYSGSLAGLLSLFPEAAVAAVLGMPLFRKLNPEAPPERIADNHRAAQDMVNTMALSHRGKSGDFSRRLEEAMVGVAPLLRSLTEADRRVPRAEYERVCREAADLCCKGCDRFSVCGGELGRLCPAPFSLKLAAGAPLSLSDFASDGLPPCPEANAERCLDAIRRSAAALEEARYRLARSDETADVCEWLAKLMNDARLADGRECAANEPQTEKAKEIFLRAGFPDGAVRVLGERQLYLTAAGEDTDGSKITDAALQTALADALGAHFGVPNYFRRDGMALMECTATPRFRVEAAVAAAPGEPGAPNGDRSLTFTTVDGRFFALLSDGMGTGAEAERVSAFAVEFLAHLLGAGCDKTTSLHLLNRLLRRQGEECSTSVDLFAFDLLSGEGQFCKSGAAPSYILREGSLFRVRSQTVPLGLMKTLDAERIRVEAAPGDLIVMVSDGVCPSPEDAPWLPELLSKPLPADLSRLAGDILAAATRNAAHADDMTVLVCRVLRAA